MKEKSSDSSEKEFFVQKSIDIAVRYRKSVDNCHNKCIITLYKLDAGENERRVKMGILLEEDYSYELPELTEVRQHFPRECLMDIEETVRRELQKKEIADKVRKGSKVAVAVGSRGIRHLAVIVKTLIEELEKMGAKPYIVSAMGSHGGGTAQGQREILKSYGITECEMGVPVITDTEVDCVGKTSDGQPVYFDRAARQADAIIPVNRIKLHTDFVGELQSGLCKMLVIGLGNQIGCSAIHETEPEGFGSRIEEAARIILKQCPVLGGLGIVENAYDQTCFIEAVPREGFIEREKELVEIAKTKMPALMIPKIDILIVEEIGKNISGAGYDPNILGRSSVLKEFLLPVPEIKQMVLLDISEESHGNGIGIGLFDVALKQIFHKLDFTAMYANALACKCIEDVKIPLLAESEEEAVRAAAKCIRGVRGRELRIVKIKNTLELEKIWVSEAVLEDIRSNPKLEAIK